jgi:CelD/BcsL family acetyltransferase involved in cellulose biosynthesis
VADGLAASRVSFDTAEARAEWRGASASLFQNVSTIPNVFIEHATKERLTGIDAAWRDLAARALEPNVFMNPALLHAAMAAAPDRKFAVFLAWDGAHSNARLIGIWGFDVTRALVPVRVLKAPGAPHAYLATPVVDRLCCHAVLNALCDAITASDDLPKIIALTPVASGGPVMAALKRVMAERAGGLRIFETRQRPLLLSGGNGKSYFEAALSSSSRKKLRQHRRRLAERGNLQLRLFETLAAVTSAFEEFLSLESSGWKGRAGDALACSESDAAYSRAMIRALAEQGDAQIHALYLDGKPVSMQIVLRGGPVAYTWKTAYDETLHDFSPGMLLLEDYTTAFLSDPRIASVDSCSFDDSGFMAVWRDRAALADLWLDVRRGSSFNFALNAKCHAAVLLLRGHLKSLYNRGLKRWTTRKS